MAHGATKNRRLPRPGNCEVRQENWTDLHDLLGVEHFINVVPEKLSEDEFLKLISFVREVTEGQDADVLLGSFFDEDRQRPVDDHRDLGIYVHRSQGWSPSA